MQNSLSIIVKIYSTFRTITSFIWIQLSENISTPNRLIGTVQIFIRMQGMFDKIFRNISSLNKNTKICFIKSIYRNMSALNKSTNICFINISSLNKNTKICFIKSMNRYISSNQTKFTKVGRREAAAARLGLNKRKKKKEKLDIEEVLF